MLRDGIELIPFQLDGDRLLANEHFVTNRPENFALARPFCAPYTDVGRTLHESESVRSDGGAA
jgi:hypothetical protein